MSCDKCEKYTVSCPILEGFECCRCCGVGGCEYDICPPEEKLPIIHTRYELRYLEEVSYDVNCINNCKDAFLKKEFDIYYWNRFLSCKRKLHKLKKQVLNDKNIRKHIRTKILKHIADGFSSGKDLENLILNKSRKYKKKGNFKYFKRNLDKFSIETIDNIRKLSNNERSKLFKLKRCKIHDN